MVEAREVEEAPILDHAEPVDPAKTRFIQEDDPTRKTLIKLLGALAVLIVCCC